MWYFVDSFSVFYNFIKSVVNGVVINVVNIVFNVELKVYVDFCGIFYDYDLFFFVENFCMMSIWKVVFIVVLLVGVLVGGILLIYRLYRMKVFR